MIRTLPRHPLFLVGLLLRLLMLTLLLPQAAQQWYIPFLDLSTDHFTLDPWAGFLADGGPAAAFPYGYVMWAAFLPLTLLVKLLGAPVYLGYGLTLLAADLALLCILRLLLNTRERLLLVGYWLSPIVLFATYWLGFNDLIPVALLGLALYGVKQHRPLRAGALCGAAISAKLSMGLAVPFFCIYLFRNRALRPYLKTYLQGFGAAAVLFGLPFLLSASGMQMLTSNPEMGKVYQLAVQIGDAAPVYVLPMAYLLMLYLAWRMRRTSFELFNVLLGMAFFLVVLLTPAAPGWFLWIMPVLILYQAMSGRTAVWLVSGFTVLYVLTTGLNTPRPLILGSNLPDQLVLHLKTLLGARGDAVLHTMLLTYGVILALRIWREAVRANEYFRLSRKPFVIGIAGDSGAGKDTLSDALAALFGTHSVVKLSGDDYHLWDRHKPMWQVMTHLNPRANDLERYAQDLVALADGQPIHARHYDHETGKMTHPHRVDSNDFILAQGLHALHLPILRDRYDLSIYLDIDEDLRRHFKIKRDVHVRGHALEKVLASLEKREADSARFVRTQAAHADLILSLRPIHAQNLADAAAGRAPLRFKLFARSRQGLNEESLVRALVGLCGLHVDMTMNAESGEVDLSIEGETTAEDIALAADTLFPRIHEFLDVAPRWESGIPGLMQLITLSHINQSLSKRLV